MSDGARTGIYLWVASTVLIVGVLCWITWHQSAWLTEQGIRQEQDTEAHIEYAEENIARECLEVEAVALRNCVKEQYESAYEHHRANYDLDAQQEMALYTRVMGITAVFGVALGLGSIVLIYYTLQSTQQMARDTRRIGEAQIRAYLSVDSADFRIDFRNGLTEKMPDIDLGLFFSNSGQTPAVNISYFCWAEISTHNDIELFSDREKYDFHSFTNTVAANSKVRRRVVPFGILNEVSEGWKMSGAITESTTIGEFPIVKLNGVVFYEDVFGAEFKSNFSFWLDAPKSYGLNVSLDDLEAVQATIPVFERIESRADYVADQQKNE